jgi:hypothetical protein
VGRPVGFGRRVGCVISVAVAGVGVVGGSAPGRLLRVCTRRGWWPSGR